jgi:hypothetical protein
MNQPDLEVLAFISLLRTIVLSVVFTTMACLGSPDLLDALISLVMSWSKP